MTAVQPDAAIAGATLAGKVALITGSGNLKGIGRGIAEALAAEGAGVVINYTSRPEEAEIVAGQLRERGTDVLMCRADISELGQVEDMFAAILEHFGRLDVLVNNAGVCVWEEFVDLSAAGFDRMTDVNILGTFACSRRAATAMVERGIRGRIINIASGHARRPMPLMSGYGATKAAIDHLSQSLALELAPYGITVNQLWPGFVDTDINGEKPELATDEGRRALLATIPIGAAATPADLGAAAVYLAGPAGDKVTGAILKIDGGQHIRCI